VNQVLRLDGLTVLDRHALLLLCTEQSGRREIPDLPGEQFLPIGFQELEGRGIRFDVLPVFIDHKDRIQGALE